ncbi:SufD family Fe-S cluster assembly protein [bacterium]|nr:SufD family Fe-S cluster assembly protein [bacterium]
MPQIPKQFIESARMCNFDVAAMKNANTPHLYVAQNNILSAKETPNFTLKTRRLANGVKIKMTVKKGMKIDNPIFLCFGILNATGKQYIIPEIILEENSEAKIFAHCTFPQAKHVLHQMKAKIRLKKGAKLLYIEKHYHGENFGAQALANFDISLGQNSSFKNDFSLQQGSVGKLKIGLKAQLQKGSFAEILSKIIEKGEKDKVEVFDRIILEGPEARGLVKMRGAAVDGGKVFFQGKMEADKLAKGARGHIDCQEIIVGKNSFAQSIPIVAVNNPEARITHEASVGKVNQKELETLITRGLSEKEAIDFIIRGKIK